MIRYFRTPRVFRILFPNRTWGFSSTTQIYLTFDDGPHPEITPWILDELAYRNIKGTFFCLGENILAHPKLVDRIRSEGHALAYHGFNHNRNSKRSIQEIKRDLLSAPNSLTKRYYRPPYGRLSWWKATAIPRDWKIIMWSWLSYDFDQTLSIDQLVSRAKSSIRPGDILVFHDNNHTKDRLKLLLPPILDFIESKGWKAEVLD